MSKSSTPSDIGCLEAIEAMQTWLDGELDDPQSVSDFENHLAHCRSCYTRAEMEKALSERIRRAARQTTPDALQARVKKLMDKF